MLLVCAVGAGAQQAPQKKDSKAAPQQEEQAPPEEDAIVGAKEYTFNPLQASKELKVGNYYYKQIGRAHV